MNNLPLSSPLSLVRRATRSASLATTIGWRAVLAAGAVLAVAFAAITFDLQRRQGAEGLERLRQSTGAVWQQIDGADRVARDDAERLAAVFRALYPAGFTLIVDPQAGGTVLGSAGQPVAGRFDEVDAFARMTGGVATVFGVDGEDFVRLTTSLKKADGSRAVGTRLGTTHPGYALLRSGRPYTGRATLFGRTYATRYEPIAEGGRVVGILFVGFDLGPLLAALGESLAGAPVFSSGRSYLVMLEAQAQGRVVGVPDARPLSEAPGGGELLAALAGRGEGYLQVRTPTPADPAGAVARHLAYRYHPGWEAAVVTDVGDDDLHAMTRATAWRLWIAAALGLAAMAIVVGRVVSRAVARPLEDLTGHVERLSAGRLDTPMHSRRADEVGRLVAGLERFRTTLVGSLRQVTDAAGALDATSREIAQGNQDLSARTEQQAASLEQTAAAIVQMSTALATSAENARQADALAGAAVEVAGRGGAVVGAVVERMDAIRAASRRVGEIVGVIDGIAFQTNILALNAAVEAARAGEQGRGFAVVAGEVRTLAQRAAQSAREIRGLIDDTVARIEGGSKQAGEAGALMGEIVAQARRVSALVGEITTAMVEQSGGVGEVNRAVADLDAMTQRNAALVEQSAGAAAGLRDQAAELARAASVFELGRRDA